MTTDPFTLAQAFLEGVSLAQKDFKDLIKALKDANQFLTGRRVLERALAKPDQVLAGTKPREVFAVWLKQQRALCAYKNPEQPPISRLHEALTMLEEIDLFDGKNRNAETLGLGGAIFKRLWEQEGNHSHLHAALSLYRAGWERGDDAGYRAYCGVNAVFVLDQMAYLAERAAAGVAGDRSESECLRQRANDLRRAVLALQDAEEKNLPAGAKQDEWHDLTRGELLFGLGDYAGAKASFASARQNPPADWKIETSVRQLLDLARCQNLSPTPEEGDAAAHAAWGAVAELLGTDADAAHGLLRGRVGLALSGGGFRASFYHLGVLARFAEADALRHVEVISTVSGGSVVGVLYYLEVKALIERKSDLTITREDYIEIVQRVQNNFFKATRRNLRLRMLTDFWANLKMVFTDYSRSHRIGELFEDEIYSTVGSVGRRRVMPDLLITPAGHDPSQAFKPHERNWRRRNKVPVLLINTTALNSGHNFQFTANWMGEPPGLIGAEVDMNARLERVYYRDAPTEELRCFPLGHAVAASACVPALFEPLTLEDFYPGRTVRLVDGGVHDNQGISGLLDESCTFILCSDASGQMHDEDQPGNGLLGSALRSSDIGQDRVREAQYEDLAMRERSGSLSGLFFVHLKEGLEAETVAPCGAPQRPSPQAQPNQTPYGIDRGIQARLAELRTDLDSFTEVEAQSLMLSGYLVTGQKLRDLDTRHKRKGGSGRWGQLDTNAPEGKWPFLALREIAAKPVDSTDLRRRDLGMQLEIGKNQFFKAFRILCCLQNLAWLVGLLLLGGLGWWVHENWWMQLFEASVGWTVLVVGAAALGALLPVTKLFRPKTAKRGVGFRVGLALFGWLVARVHLCFIEPRLQARGKVARLLRLPAERP